MKKLSYILMGMVLGAALAIAGSAYADDVKGLLGLKVGSIWTLEVDGKVVGEVPIIKGSSYGPIRQIAEIAGMGVDFEQGVVKLTTIPTGVTEPSYTTAEEIEARIAALNISLKGYRGTLIATESEVYRDKDGNYREGIQEWIDETQESIAKLEAEIAELEAKLAELESDDEAA